MDITQTFILKLNILSSKILFRPNYSLSITTSKWFSGKGQTCGQREAEIPLSVFSVPKEVDNCGLPPIVPFFEEKKNYTLSILNFNIFSLMNSLTRGLQISIPLL